MIHFARFPRSVGAATAGLLLGALAAGCSILGSAAPDGSRYYVISSIDNSTIVAPARKRADIHFGVGPVKLPGYLQVQAIVRTGSSGRVEYVRDAFWAESVDTAFARALLHRTGARIGTTHSVAYPWYATTRVDWRVPVDVLRFEATDDGKAVLVARWSVESTASGEVVAGAESSFEEVGGQDPAVVVDALSHCIDRLAETIAAAVAGAAPEPSEKTAPAAAGRSAAAAKAEKPARP